MDKEDRNTLDSTLEHIDTLRCLVGHVVDELMFKTRGFDYSKLFEPEFEKFAVISAKMKDFKVGSKDYDDLHKQLPYEHHHANNRHHPNHYEKGLLGMNLIDVLEMSLDWKLESLGDPVKSIKDIETHQKKYGFSDQLKNIFINTAKMFDNEKVETIDPNKNKTGFKQS